jgi:hypothetical protein
MFQVKPKRPWKYNLKYQDRSKKVEADQLAVPMPKTLQKKTENISSCA